jgi:hypothetical protein
MINRGEGDMLHARRRSEIRTSFWKESLKEKGHFEDLGIDRSQKNRKEGCGLDSSGPRWAPVEGSCEHNYEPSTSINAGNFLTTEQLLASQERLCSIYLVGLISYF